MPTVPRFGTQAQEVTDILIQDITSGSLPEGSRVSEPELSRRYGIGRGPLREAILRLEGMGLVVRAPHVGARVVTLNHRELSEIFAIREALEGMAARLAAAHMTDHELEELGQLLENHARFVEDNEGQAYIDQNGDYDFHYRIIIGSRNQRLIRSLCDELYHLIQMYRKSSGGSSSGNNTRPENTRPENARPEKALIEHQMIFKALKDRDGDLAEILMRRHIGRARKEIQQFIEAATD